MNIVKRFWKKCVSIPKNTTNPQKEKQSKVKLLGAYLMQIKKLIVVSVKLFSPEQDCSLIYVHQNASASGEINGTEKDMLQDQSLRSHVHIAKKISKQKICHQKNIIPKLARANVQDDLDMKEVFNLTVETYGVYYVNDVLVSNCDTAADAIKIALIDKLLQTNNNKKDDTVSSLYRHEADLLDAQRTAYYGDGIS